MEEQLIQIIQLLVKNIETEQQLIEIIRNKDMDENCKIETSLVIKMLNNIPTKDLVEQKADVSRVWMVAFFSLAAFLLVLITIFLGFLNSR